MLNPILASNFYPYISLVLGIRCKIWFPSQRKSNETFNLFYLLLSLLTLLPNPQMLAYQIEQLKEDISGKESGLKSCEGFLGKCNKKNEQLRTEIQAGLAKLSEARADIAALRQEEARLNRIVQVSPIGQQERKSVYLHVNKNINEKENKLKTLYHCNKASAQLYAVAWAWWLESTTPISSIGYLFIDL